MFSYFEVNELGIPTNNMGLKGLTMNRDVDLLSRSTSHCVWLCLVGTDAVYVLKIFIFLSLSLSLSLSCIVCACLCNEDRLED